MATSGLVKYLDDWRNVLILFRRIQPQYPDGWLSIEDIAAELGISRSAVRERIQRMKKDKVLMQRSPHFDPTPGEVTGWDTYEQLATETGLSPSGVAARVTQMKRDPRLKTLLEGQAPKTLREAVSQDLGLILLETVPTDSLPVDLRPISTTTKEIHRLPYSKDPVALDTTNLPEMLKFTFRQDNIALRLEAIHEDLLHRGLRISMDNLAAFLNDFDRITFNSEEKSYHWA